MCEASESQPTSICIQYCKLQMHFHFVTNDFYNLKVFQKPLQLLAKTNNEMNAFIVFLFLSLAVEVVLSVHLCVSEMASDKI